MEKLEPYKNYKKSNIDWLGDVPEHWKIMKARNLGVFNGSTVDKKIDEEQDKVRLVNFLDVFNNPRFEITEKKFMVVTAKEEQIKKFKVNIGDVVFTPSSEVTEDIGRSAVIKYEANDLVHSYHIIRLKFNSIFDINFKKYLFNNYFVLKYFSKVCSGSTRKILTRQNFNNIPLVIPSLPEQTAIANFLDYKTAKIDRFISKKKQLIKLLNEQKAGIINNAVTKGLNPKVKMKPSGIEWLGDIPAHWEVKKLKYIGVSVLGKMLCNEDKGNYSKKPYLKSKNIQWLNVDTNDVEEMWFSAKELNQYRLKKGDLVLSEGGEVGKTCIWNEEIEECYIQNSAHKITFNFDNIADFFLYLFFLYGKKGAFDAITNKVSIGHLTKDKLINLKCVSPPKDEQISIVSHIEKETALLNKTIDTIEKEIALTQEYRTSLIAEAVTGKIDVRNYKVPEIVEEEELTDDTDEVFEETTNDDEL